MPRLTNERLASGAPANAFNRQSVATMNLVEQLIDQVARPVKLVPKLPANLPQFLIGKGQSLVDFLAGFGRQGVRLLVDGLSDRVAKCRGHNRPDV